MFNYFGYIPVTWNGLYRNGLYDSSILFLKKDKIPYLFEESYF